MKETKFDFGFTIIELIIAITIIAILAGVAIPLYINLTDEAHSAHIDAVEGVLHSAVILWASENYIDSGELIYPNESIVTIEYMTDPGYMTDWTDLGNGLWQHNPTGGTLKYDQTNNGTGYEIIKIYSD